MPAAGQGNDRDFGLLVVRAGDGKVANAHLACGKLLPARRQLPLGLELYPAGGRWGIPADAAEAAVMACPEPAVSLGAL